MPAPILKPEQAANPALPADWLRPDWPAPSHVHALFTSRSGGVSGAPWHSLNVGSHVGDKPANVAANRAVLQAAMGSRPIFLNQTHGTQLAVLSRTSPDGAAADAAMTAERGVACTVMVADCLPVLFASACGSVVGAAHAGWRGLAGSASANPAQGVLETTVAAIFKHFKATDQLNRARAAPEMIAWLGPCIGPTAFEVGAEVKAAFEEAQAGSGQCFVAAGPGKFMADLPGLARRRLQALGISQIYGNDSSLPWCTASNGSRFFSHRRDGTVLAGVTGSAGGNTGRMAASIWLA